MSADIHGIQSDLRAAKIDGWLFYDFRGRDPIAQNILNLPAGMRTRRWFYFVPAKGTPKKLVHKIETQSLAALPGDALLFGTGGAAEEFEENVWAREKRGDAILAEERDPLCVHGGCGDGGTSAQFGAEGGEFGGLVQKYEACWSAEQLSRIFRRSGD